MSGDIPPLPNTPSWCGAQLKHRDNYTSNPMLGLYIEIGHDQLLVNFIQLVIQNNLTIIRQRKD
jgi:hypothetical protein